MDVQSGFAGVLPVDRAVEGSGPAAASQGWAPSRGAARDRPPVAVAGRARPRCADYAASRPVTPPVPVMEASESWGDRSSSAPAPIQADLLLCHGQRPEGSSGGGLAGLRRRFGGWHHPIPALLEAADPAVLHHDPDEVRLEGGEDHDAVRHLPAVPGRARKELRRDRARRRASGPARLRSGIAVPWHHAARSSRAEAGPFGGARTPPGTASGLYAAAARAPLARPPASRPARPPFSPGRGARPTRKVQALIFTRSLPWRLIL